MIPKEEETTPINHEEDPINRMLHEDVIKAEQLYVETPTPDEKLKSSLCYFPLIQLGIIPYKNQSKFIEFHFLRGMIVGNGTLVFALLFPISFLWFLIGISLGSYLAY